MKFKNKKIIFIVSITENALKIAKCLAHNSKREFLNLEIQALPAAIDEKDLSQTLKPNLEKLGFNNNPLVLCLARHQATCRHLKLPTSSIPEIEKIASLQAARYLPYPANELITGFQIISTDAQNFTHINLVIVHRNVIERYLAIFKELNIKNFNIVLSSYGLSNLYCYLNPQDSGSLMVIDIDSREAESVIISNKKIVFSRYFKINRGQTGWEDLFIDEVNNTRDAYFKEASQEAPERIVILGEKDKQQALSELLNKRLKVKAGALPFAKAIGLTDELKDKVLNSENSFSLLIGLGLGSSLESLNLLPDEEKAKLDRIARLKELTRIALSIAVITLLWVVIINKNLDNKTMYLARLKQELSKVSHEAAPLEEAKKRIMLVENSSQKRISGLDVLYELHRLLPQEASLLNLGYEEDNQVILHGEAAQLNTVFALVSKLQDSSVFKKFNIKVRYATAKRGQTGEMVDFEIICAKK